MNNPEFPKKLRREIEGLQQDMRVWQESLSGAREDTVKSWYYNKIMKAQYLFELKKDDLVRVEDRNYQLRSPSDRGSRTAVSTDVLACCFACCILEKYRPRKNGTVCRRKGFL